METLRSLEEWRVREGLEDPQSPEAVVVPPEDAGAAAALATLGDYCPLPIYTAGPDSV